MSITNSVTMANIKPEDGETAIWQGYSLQPPLTTSASLPPLFESNYPSPALSNPYLGRPQKGTYRPLDIPAIQMRPPPQREGDETQTVSPPAANSHHSYPTLKRSYSQSDSLPFGEVVQDFRDDGPEASKPNISQDHRLLSFSRLPEKHTILDSKGRVQHVELTAQIHGMFFLSELATPQEGLAVQPELTCYRRNLFQISGSVSTPRGAISVLAEGGGSVPVISMEVVISAMESVDGNVVKLIVIPWKTPPANSPEIPVGQEQEPAPIPLAPLDESPDANKDFAVHPIAYRRLQFRVATANNGRRRELQQHFNLHMNVVGTLSNGTRLNVCETSTSPIVVRGRSPRNFQARKEIALVGSSSSRGPPPELHVSTNIQPNNEAKLNSASSSKHQTRELPRSPFTFDSASVSGSPSILRQPYVSISFTIRRVFHTLDIRILLGYATLAEALLLRMVN